MGFKERHNLRIFRKMDGLKIWITKQGHRFSERKKKAS